MGNAVRLQLDAVAAPVVARVAHREQGRMVVAHPLPFLRLQGGVRDEEGRAARIEAVRLDVEDDTPSLIMEVVYDPAPEPFRVAPRDDDTLPGFVPDMADASPGRRDATVSFETARPRPRSEVVVSDRPPAARVSRWAHLWSLVVAWARRAEAFVDELLGARRG